MSLVDALIAFIDEPGTERERDELACRLHEERCEAIPAYARLAKGREVRTIHDVPAVPEVVYRGGGPRRQSEVARTFRSSGTSGDQRTVIELSEPGLEIMNTAILAGARRHLFPEGVAAVPLLLLPSPDEAPDVVMVYGMNLIGERYGLQPPSSFISGGRFEFARLTAALEIACQESQPVFLAGGSFAFVHFLEFCEQRDWRIELPLGSRSLDAGGYKGRSRAVHPSTLRSLISERLGIDAAHQTNLLGMTELASQIYDGELAEATEGSDGFRVKKPDPWVATSVLDPITGAPQDGLGMLRHTDLAIYDRPFALLTADLGRAVDGGFVFVRRAAKVSHRGCALAHEVMEAAASA